MEAFLLIVLAALAFTLARILGLRLLSPPPIMTIVWSIFILAGLIFIKDYEWNYIGLIWILISCIAVIVGFFIGNMILDKTYVQHMDRNSVQPNTHHLRQVLLVAIFLGLIYAALKMQSLNVVVSDMFSLETLGEVNNDVALTRYYGDGGAYSLLIQFLLSFVYLCPLLGGLLFSLSSSKKDKPIAFLAFLPELLTFAFTNEKATLIICVLLWFSAYLVGILRIRGEIPKIRPRQIISGVLISVCILATLMTSMMLRIGSIDALNFNIVLQKVGQNYALSHVPAFDQYFSKGPSDSQLQLGTVTFYGISNFLGIKERDQGIYDDDFSSGEFGTNVYTAFRGLIEDFGKVGALFFQMIVAILAGACYWKIRFSNRNPYMSIALLTAFFTFVLYSFIASVFSYLSIIVAFIFFTAILAINPLIVKPESTGR